MEIHIKITGWLLIALSLMHIVIPKYFKWEQELTSLSLVTKRILYVHTFFIAFVVLLMGLLCLNYSQELVHDPFGRVISLGLFGFWLTRSIFQFFVYSPKVWRGKRFETVMHIMFSVLWLYFTGVFLLGSLEPESISLHGEGQFNHGPGYYGTPYDSTQGVPGYVFVGCSVLIILFLFRLAWEYRDEIFKKNDE
ncbi:MAG TPA: hypothetical protein VFI14_09280 [Chryseosolibacter sp.]|nr:hypothetical protein [Chryseosolibacter sp.]